MSSNPLITALKKQSKRGLMSKQQNKFQAGQTANLGMFGASPASPRGKDMANPSAIAQAMKAKGKK